MKNNVSLIVNVSSFTCNFSMNVPYMFLCYAKKTYRLTDVGGLHTDGGIATSIAWGIAPCPCEKIRKRP